MSPQEASSTSATLLGLLRQRPHDQQSWGLFVRRYGPVIYEWSRHHGLPHHDAEDVTQDVLVRMSRCLQSFVYDPALSFRGYLRRVTEHACCDFARSREQRERGSGDSAVLHTVNQLAAREDLVQRLEKEFDRELFEQACRRVRLRVEPQRWEAFRLRQIEGLSGADVAQQLGMPVASVYGAQRDVRRMLQEEVQKLDRQEGGP